MLQRQSSELWRLESKQRRRDKGEEDVRDDEVRSHESPDYTPANRTFALKAI